ncbi:hypothetical protein [Streptomyces sp. CdTB01]|uniref:hypothetical protein n=1 Tax=Streptomyces sp. CdTB01 TaxID=1725411 RepID=UPI00073A71F3|nr:hypothetical protein [Streptomyces sp. CdTB01]ALV38264.1 hypothetical protein AS200_00175 [Streptomyces sp. CdTB01]
MSKTTELTSQYSAQVASDLERNLKEQENLSGEIEALQARLASVQHDHTVLVNLQQALGVPAPAAAAVAESAASMPAARKKTTGTSGSAKKSAAPRKRSGKKIAAEASATSSVSPTLVDLVREHLTGQSEPRSAAEITTALEQLHPERTVKTTVVRTTLEGLVAKSQAQRTKQGKSVYYTASDTAAPADSGEQSV